MVKAQVFSRKGKRNCRKFYKLWSLSALRRYWPRAFDCELKVLTTPSKLKWRCTCLFCQLSFAVRFSPKTLSETFRISRAWFDQAIATKCACL